jgi:hypothetical protein
MLIGSKPKISLKRYLSAVSWLSGHGYKIDAISVAAAVRKVVS